MMKKLLWFLLICPLWLGAQAADPDSVLHRYERDRARDPQLAHQHILFGIDRATKRNDKYHVALYLVKLIEEQNFLRNYDGAYKAFRRAEQYCLTNKIESQLPCAYSQYAESCFNKEDLAQSMKYFKAADSVFAKQKDGIGVVISKNNIANIYQVQGRYDLAIKNLLEAAKNVDTSQYRYIKVSIYNNICDLYKTIDDAANAEIMARKALKLALVGKKDNPEGLLTSYVQLSGLLVDAGREVEAEKYIGEGLRLADAEKLGAYRFELMKCDIALKMVRGQLSQARSEIMAALALGEKHHKNTNEMYPVRSNLAKIYLADRQTKQAIALLRELLGEAKEIGRRDDMAKIYGQLAEAYEQAGDFRQALVHRKLFEQAHDSLLGREKQQFFKDAQVRYQTAIKEKQLAQNKVALLRKEAESKRKSSLILMLGALAFFLALLAYLIYRQQQLRAAQREKEFQLKSAIGQIETQNKLQEQRLRISRDLHDNIGAQLTFIISSVDNVKFGFNLQNTKLNDKLDSISEFTKTTILELRDTIWAMNHAEISFEELQSRIFNFLEKAKTAREGISYNFTLEETVREMVFSSLQGINLYRSIQEAVNNAIKHAGASRILIEARTQDGRIEVDIRDNGVGFDTTSEESGNGLGNMAKRMKEIGGDCAVQSAPGGGTVVSLSFKPGQEGTA